MTRRTSRQGARLAALAVAATLSACGTTVQLHGSGAPVVGDGLSADGPASAAPSGTTSSNDPGTAVGDLGSGPSLGSAPSSSATSTPGRGPVSTAGGQAVGLAGAASGPGWTAKVAYVGVPTAEDLHQAAGSFGVSFDPGSLKADAEAFIAEINTHGGLLGRKVVPLFFDVKTVESAGNPQAVAQQACSFFTQDHKVVAVLNAVGGLDTDNLRACLHKTRTPLASLGVGIYGKDHFRKDGPFLYLHGAPAVERFVPAWIERLLAQGYFGGRNTVTGASAPGAAKVGLMEPNTPFGKTVNASLKAQLAAQGIKVVSEYGYNDQLSSYSSEMAAAQLRFASAGVTHVLTVPPVAAALFFFMQAAEQQRYRPVYGISSYDLPIFFQQNAPKGQLVGAKGIGWFPAEDVDTAHDPGVNATHKQCLAELSRRQVRYVGDPGRVALGAALAICDSFHLLAAAVRGAKAFEPAAIARGLAGLGTGFGLAASFGGYLTPEHPALISATRDLAWATDCSCFRYSGPIRAL